MSTDLASMVLKAYNTKWSFINNFKVQFKAGDALWSAANCSNKDLIQSEDLNLFIKGIDTPQLNYSVISEYTGAKYNLATGRKSDMSLTLHFRDYDQCVLYRSFCKLWQAQDLLYLDEIGIQIDIYKGADYKSDKEDMPLMSCTELIIENVSQMQFSNETEAQIAEFDVGFRGPYPVIG